MWRFEWRKYLNESQQCCSFFQRLPWEMKRIHGWFSLCSFDCLECVPFLHLLGESFIKFDDGKLESDAECVEMKSIAVEFSTENVSGDEERWIMFDWRRKINKTLDWCLDIFTFYYWMDFVYDQNMLLNESNSSLHWLTNSWSSCMKRDFMFGTINMSGSELPSSWKYFANAILYSNRSKL